MFSQIQKNYIPLRVAIIVLVLIGVVIFGKRIVSKPEEVHIHAGFLVYKNGTQEDFSDFKYMDIKPCGDNHGVLTPEEEQREKAHLHEGIGDVVHVHRKSAIWGDLFTNINYSIGSSDMRAYANGTLIKDPLTREIIAYESVTFVLGNEAGVDFTKRVTKEHILEVEAKSELCSAEETHFFDRSFPLGMRKRSLLPRWAST